MGSEGQLGPSIGDQVAALLPIARRAATRLSSRGLYDAAFSGALAGIWEAVLAWDGRGNLGGFAYRLARQRAIDRLHSEGSPGQKKDLVVLRDVDQLGEAEAVAKYGARKIALAHRRTSDLHLEDVWPARDDDGLSTPEIPVEVDPSEDLMRSEFWSSLPISDPRLRWIVIRYYRDGLKGVEIAKELGISASRTSQLRKRAIATLAACSAHLPDLPN